MEKILKKLKKLLRLIFGRTTLGTLFLLIQILVLFAGFNWFREYLIYMYGGSAMLSALILIYIISDEGNSTIKLSWVVPILVFPVFGTLFYLFLTLQPGTHRINRRIEEVGTKLRPYLLQDPEVLAHYESISASGGNLVRYMNQYGRFPAYENTGARYFPLGDDMFPVLLEELKKAEHFIFMEYHAIEDAESFARLKHILENKAQSGVEVRIFYDDLGSIFFLNKEFIKQMRQKGIQCRVFNPLKVIVNMFMNNRDHRKITVIDGKVGFTGGYNLADEYFNITHPYGYWKDTGIKLQGDAVKSLTASFLTMWNAIEHTDNDYNKYLDATDGTYKAVMKDCYVQPYSDNPLGQDRIGEDVYLNILKNAKDYVYITTPYLIITDEMERELRLAVKRGVDVRIVTPGIPDKKLVYRITRSYYEPLCSAGVRIYEYTPGFCHAKQWVCDDEVSVVGTINMDYRSLYLHFENAVFIYNKATALSVKQDMLNNFEAGHEVTADYAKDVIKPLRLGVCMLRMISPLL